MIVTADIAQYLDLTGGDYYGFTADNNFFNQVIDVYQQIWPFIVLIPLFAAVLFAGDEYQVEQLAGGKVSRLSKILKLPYRAVYWVTIFPLSRLFWSGWKRALLSVFVVIAVSAAHTYHLDHQANEYDRAREFVTALYAVSDTAMSYQDLKQLQDNEQIQLDKSYGEILYVYWPVFQLTRFADELQGHTENQRSWMNSYYAGRNILSLMLEEVNMGRKSARQCLLAMDIYNQLGGKTDVKDSSGMPVWALIRSMEAYRVVKALDITLSAETKAIILDNLTEYESFGTLDRYHNLIQGLRE